MKNTIAWHEECLTNQKASLSEMIRKYYKIKEEVARLKKQSDFYAYQIACAKDANKDSFDKDKYKVKRFDHGDMIT